MTYRVAMEYEVMGHPFSREDIQNIIMAGSVKIGKMDCDNCGEAHAICFRMLGNAHLSCYVFASCHRRCPHWNNIIYAPLEIEAVFAKLGISIVDIIRGGTNGG